MKSLTRLLLAFALAAPGGAFAQTATVPVKVAGFGTLSVAGASVLVNTLTAGPNSPAFPGSQLNMTYVMNSPASANTLFVCPLGGTCATTTGIPVAVGAAFGCNQCLVTMTVISAGTATAVVQW